jgi:hypothetical protein
MAASFSLRAVRVGLALSPLWGCSPAASTVPLSNAQPEGPEVYFYGDARRGGKVLPEDADDEAAAGPARAEPSKPRKEAEKAEPAAEAAPSASASSDPAANLPEVAWEKLPGDYRGTDTLTIDVDGLPQRVETDEKAKFVVETKDEKQAQYVFKIVDSQNGGDLCSVVGTAKRTAVEFEAGQSCLAEILGLPMKATLESGSATLSGSKLTVTFSIELAIDTPRGTQDGAIAYKFEGDRQ